ncbi:MAG: imidazolonepropionase [Bacteroidales bacterium]|nr:imidazolonepropionase [Bacteroidales bacterium]MBR3386822.1 imidazolonepropionase [Bacteroidales bacterium]
MIIKNIGELVGIVPEGVLRKQGAEMAETGVLKDAWIAVEDGRIAGFGPMGTEPDGAEVIDAEGGMVMPAFCDSHTHIVYAGSRDGEFLDKINGLSYEEIAARGGGILNSADLLHETSEDELFRQSMVRVREMMAKGTGAIEIKSGYGLNPADELKMLRVIRRIKETVPALVKSTFLGAHAIGRGYTHEGYVQAVVDMMPQAAELADFVDVFCDEGFFTVDDTDRILAAGAAFGLRPKIHANELAVSGGVQVGVKHNALSVDHLERTTDAEIDALRGAETMPTMLPGSSFFLGIPFGRAKEFIDAGLGIALASDYNPGSSPSGDMRFIMALACIRMRLTPVQALNAVTLNSAYAMGLSDITGSITPGKRTDLILTRPGWTLTKLPYLHQTPFIRQVFLGGTMLK